MRLKEIFNNETYKNEEVKSLGELGAIAFGSGKTDKNEERTPHYEITRCIEMYENNPIVNSSINQMMLWLFPNDKIKIDSEDENTKKFLEDWHNLRPGILNQYKNILMTNMICGNAPVETYRTENEVESGIKKKVLDNVYSFNDMSRIYRNVNGKEDGSDAFIFELKFGTKQFKYRGKILQPTFHQVSYIKNYQYIMNNIYGIPISSEQMKIYMSGWSRDNLYGRSQLASAIDANNIFNEIMSSWDTISKTKQIDQKIISLSDNVDQPVEVSQDRLNELGEELEMNDKSYILFNQPLKFVQQDVDVSGKYDLMEGVFDLVRRMLIMSLLPQHLTPWSDSATTQGADSSMPPFMSRLKSKQNEFINWHKENILNELIQQYNLSDDATLEIDEPKILPDSEYIDTVTRLKQEEIINNKKAKEILAKLGIIEEDEEEGEKPNEDKSAIANDPEEDKKESFGEVDSQPITFEQIKKKVRDNGENTRKWKQVLSRKVNNNDLKVAENEVEYILFENGKEIKRISKKNMTKEKLNNIVKTYKQYLKQI